MACKLSIPANDQATEVLQPCECPFYRPATLVTPQFAAVVIFSILVVLAVRADQFDASAGQSFSKRIAIVALVGNNPIRIFSRTTPSGTGHGDLLDRRFEQGHLTRRGRIEMSTERDSLAIDHHHPLRTFSAFGLADAAPPFFAGAKLPSAKVSSHCNWDRSSSSDKNLRQMASQIPCCSHCCNRRQQVVGEGYCLGKSFQRAPLRRIHAMPSKTSRLSLGLRPPLEDGLYLGSNGSIFFHCSSVTNFSFLAIGVPFFDSQKYTSPCMAQV